MGPVISVFPPDGGIGLSVIIVIGPYIGIPYRGIISSIGPVVHQAETYCGPCKVSVERTVYIIPVIHIYITNMVTVYPPVVIVDIKTAHSGNPSIVIKDIYVPYLGDPTVIIIIDGYVLYLDHRSIIIVLYVGVIVVSRVIGNLGMA